MTIDSVGHMVPASLLKLMLLVIMLPPLLSAYTVSINVSHSTTDLGRVNQRIRRKTTSNKLGLMKRIEDWLPPPELLPILEEGLQGTTLMDAPTVIDGSDTELTLQFLTIEKEGKCPSKMVWFYKRESKTKSRDTEEFKKHGYICKMTLVLKNLFPETMYYIQVQPNIEVMKDSQSKYEEWYKEGDTPNPPNSLPVLIKTCSSEVPPIDNLLIHSVGHKWIALSWTPPKIDCIANLQYKIKYGTSNQYHDMGNFRSNKLGNVNGPVSPCVAWPDRHCLFLTMDLTQQRYTVVIQIFRVTDKKESDTVSETYDNQNVNLVPGPPVDLHCADAQPTSLVVRWRCPLVPGGRLEMVHISVVGSLDGKKVRHITQNAILRPEYYVQKLKNLQENFSYNVSVWFVTTSGLEGKSSSIMIWTSMLHQAVTTTPLPPTEAVTAMVITTCRSTPAVVDRQMLVKNEDMVRWIWVAACSFLLLLIIVAFFVGRRCGLQVQLKRPCQEEKKNCYEVSKTGNVSVGGAKRRRCGEAGGGVGVGDETGLCAAAAAAPSCTPPASVLEYAEVDLSTGCAWMNVARAQPLRSPSNDYEELQDDRRLSMMYSNQHYASVNDQGEAPPAYYAEVQEPKTTAAPPLPAPAAKPIPVYAQVDKEKKRAAHRQPTKK